MNTTFQIGERRVGEGEPCFAIAGETLDADGIAALRPGGGLPPSARERLIGRRTCQSIVAGTVFSLEMLE